jgi:hypothetical protein
MTDHVEYYRHRMEEELAAADGADDISVAQIHRAMADGYRRMIDERVPAEDRLSAAG